MLFASHDLLEDSRWNWMAIIFWPLHVLIPTSIRISLSLPNNIFHSLSFPPCLSFHLISVFNGLVAFGVSCWAEEDGKCSEKSAFSFLSFFLFLKERVYILWPVLFTLINNPWAQWRDCCVCVSEKEWIFPCRWTCGTAGSLLPVHSTLAESFLCLTDRYRRLNLHVFNI